MLSPTGVIVSDPVSVLYSLSTVHMASSTGAGGVALLLDESFWKEQEPEKSGVIQQSVQEVRKVGGEYLSMR